MPLFLLTYPYRSFFFFWEFIRTKFSSASCCLLGFTPLNRAVIGSRSCYSRNCCCANAYQISAGDLASLFKPCHIHTWKSFLYKHTFCLRTPPALSSSQQPFFVKPSSAKSCCCVGCARLQPQKLKMGFVLLPRKALESEEGTSDSVVTEGMEWPHTLLQM